MPRADGATYDDGIDLVARALLQSAGFLYVTELGARDDGVARRSTTTLDRRRDRHRASPTCWAPGRPIRRCSTPRPPAQLATADGREQQARRLLALPAGRQRLVRVVREWFGIDGIADIAKDTTVYPAFAGVRASMDAESVGFINEVMQQRHRDRRPSCWAPTGRSPTARWRRCTA